MAEREDMSDLIERIKKRIDMSAIKVSTCRLPHTYIKAVGTKELYKIIDEESAKEPHIVRTPEEIAHEKCCVMCGCKDICYPKDGNNNPDCEEYIEFVDFLTGKQV